MRFSITDIALGSCVLSGSWLGFQAPAPPAEAGVLTFAVSQLRTIAAIPMLAVEHPIVGAIFLLSALVVLVRMNDVGLRGRSIER